jgi:signal transduction histidine kinase
MTVDAERTAVLVKMLVDGARMETGGFRPSPEHVAVEDAAAWVVQVFGRSEDYPDVEVEGSAASLMDPDRLQSLLFTLADASMSWGGHGPVRVAVGKAGGRPVVEFSRAGAEFEPDRVEACFEPPRRGGTGKFGLWLARRLAGAQGAEVTCEQDSGALFRLTLPAGH